MGLGSSMVRGGQHGGLLTLVKENSEKINGCMHAGRKNKLPSVNAMLTTYNSVLKD